MDGCWIQVVGIHSFDGVGVAGVRPVVGSETEHQPADILFGTVVGIGEAGIPGNSVRFQIDSENGFVVVQMISSLECSIENKIAC